MAAAFVQSKNLATIGKKKKKQNFLQTIVHPLKTFSCSAQANLHVLEYQLGKQTQNTDGYATD